MKDILTARLRAALLACAFATGLAPALAADVSYAVVHEFVGETANGLTPTGDGDLYVTTGSQLYRMTADGAATLLHTFSSLNEGTSPNPVTVAANGTIYGSTQFGLGQGVGGLFAISPAGDFALIHAFDVLHGAYPLAAMIEASDGNLYGTTSQGCHHRSGSVYRLMPDGRFHAMHCFNHNDRNYNGTRPGGAVVQARDGFLYGTTQKSPNRYCLRGVCAKAYRMALDGTITASVQLRPEHGRMPVGALVQAADGMLYGVASQGGDLSTCGGVGCGTVFRLDPATMVVQLVHTFTGAGGDGAGPVNIVLGSNGMLYGRTAAGGDSADCSGGCGTMFRLSIPNRFREGWQFETVQGTPGSLIQGSGAMLFGAAGDTVFSMATTAP